MKFNKAYKLRLYPTNEQKQFFEQNFGNARFIYNKMLGDKIDHYEKTKEPLYNTPAQYKDEFEFLKLSDSLALSNVQLALDRAYKNFFRNPKFGFPKFKAKHRSKHTYTTSNQSSNGKNTIFIENDEIKLPKIGFVKVIQDRTFVSDYKIKSATISRTPTNKYFVSILVEYEKEIKSVEPETFLGLDYAMADFYVDSEGIKGNYPRFYRNAHKKLAREQRKLSKMIKGSNNYKKQRIKLAKVHEKIANQRKDFLHKASRKIANSYDVVCVEGLNMKAMSQSKRIGTQTMNFGKSIHDNGWGMFVQMLKYKLEEIGKQLVVADKFFPSTKQCSSCKNKKDEMHLSERTYDCEHCHVRLDRDLNAALNLKQYAIESILG